jgi:diguanylate cyclase (GGDEF)-like protein
MRISAITNWAYVATVLLTLLAGVSFILSSRYALHERLAVEQHLVLAELADDLELEAEKRTDEARLYIMRGDERDLAAFYVDESKERDFEQHANVATGDGASEEELSIFKEITAGADKLDELESSAILAFRAGRQPDAQQIIFGDDHHAAYSALTADVEKLRALISQRTSAALAEARDRSDLFGLIARIMLTLTATVFLGVLYFVVKKRIANPLIAMTGIINRLAKQDFAVVVPHLNRRDEIGDMNTAIEVFRSNGLERERLDAELRRDQRIKDLILQMMHRLQACQTQNEVADIVTLYMPQIFPEIAGNLFIHDETHSHLLVQGMWLEPRHAQKSLPPSECWGLRRGRPHLSDPVDKDVACSHVSTDNVTSLCVPLTALGDTVGLLYLESETPSLVRDARIYLELIAENLGLAIANLQLRDRLTGLATRDALTGLLNRRSLDEAINRLAKSKTETPQSCLMIDIDHFKRFNDEFGHDAGDAVIKHVAQILVAATSGRGHVFRFGGEEFTVFLDDLDEKNAAEFADVLRGRVATAPLSDRGRFLGVVTISIGVASAPGDGPVINVVNRADAALLTAKERGRNRVVTSSSLATELV